jgi:Tfp pilus assembly protein PilO
MSTNMRVVLAIAVTAAVVVALWTLAVAPKRQEASKLGTDVTRATARLIDANQRAATASQARATYARDYATVAKLGKAVPVTTDVPSLVYQLETAARRAKVDFRSVTASDTASDAPATGAAATAGGGIQPSPFSFRFVGDYFGLQRLLAEIDRFSRVSGTKVAVSGRLLTIDGVTINPANQGLPKVQGTITARAYVAELPDELPGATNPELATDANTPAAEVTP